MTARPFRAAAAALLALAAAGPAPTLPALAATDNKGKAMVTATEMGSMLGRLGPGLFQGSSQALTNVELSAARTDFRGLAVAAPPQVATDAQTAVPVIVLSQHTALRAWQVPEQDNLMLVVTDVDSGNLRFTRALVDPKDEEAPATPAAARAPAPGGNAATAVSTKVHRLDLPVQPGLSANLAVAALSYDLASNSVPVTLAGSRPPRPAVTRPIAPLPNAQQGLPSYAPGGPTPRPPAGHGVEFAVDLPSASAPSSLLVHGAFSKPLGTSEHLRAVQTVRDNGAERAATAVVPLTIAVLGLGWKAPRLYPVGVPIYGSPDVPPGQRVTGQFALEMPLEVTLPAGEHVAWVLMGGVPYGPRKFQVK